MSVCILGSINQDVIWRVAALPRPGETITTRDMKLLPGGKGANQAIAAARMGAATHIIGAVGDDAYGVGLSGYLAESGVDVRHVARIAGVPTGAAYIPIDDSGENLIIVVPGANARVTGDDVTDAKIGEARIVLCQLEMPIPAIAAFFERVGRLGGTRILNAAPALPEGKALFEASDMLVFNQTELASYLGLDGEPRTAEEAAVARRLLSRPGQSAVVTLGAAGAALVTASDVEFAPSFLVPVVDTTGAGDCFCGALAALLDEGVAPGQALRLANAAAALCVGREGAGPAMPSRAEVEAFLARPS
ncbi:ribokinase [Flavisphingomonas formosensis]|uniref:ribokinase n=1 Tax=Flavisphingomonas formosensis TaxID=861534 RepID=UPI0012FBE7F7|nr:ribokinase [Sphingomonas formosensis]